MSKGNSRKPSSEFKAKVALEAIKSDKILSELASNREVTHKCYSTLKKRAIKKCQFSF